MDKQSGHKKYDAILNKAKSTTELREERIELPSFRVDSKESDSKEDDSESKGDDSDSKGASQRLSESQYRHI